MSESFTAEPTVEEVALEQRATDPRLEQQQAASETPVVEEPVVDETPVEDKLEISPKPKKTAEEVLKGRVGHLTKTLSAKDQELIAERARREAAEALLAAGGKPEGSVEEPARQTTPQSKQYTQEDFETAVAERAAAEEFNRQADALYNTGAAKFQDWKDSVDTLVAGGFLDKDLLDAAMVIEDGAAVLHHLGTNLDEAERISALTPIRKAAELAKLSATLSTPRTIPVSSAPAPIKPVSGSPNPSIDLQRIADTDDMREYAAARAKQGSRWAQGRK